MKNSTSPGRRKFIKTGLLSFAGVIMLPSCLKNYNPFRFFTLEEASLLVDICDQIIPEDENGPGATKAGVIYYIDKQLSEVFADQQSAYREGLKAFRESCLTMFSKDFGELSIDDKIKFLKMLEGNEIAGDYWNEQSARDFFSIVIRHSMQGFYGPPRHGGNKNYISYKVMNLDYPYVVGQNRYRKEPVYE
ncbi:MAG: gluconate 2-dehydrogenase subunit 3 family protein [Bacteroidales bacterium]